MNAMFNIWVWAGLATLCALVMALALSLRYSNFLILWGSTPLVLVVSAALIWMVHRNGGGVG